MKYCGTVCSPCSKNGSKEFIADDGKGEERTVVGIQDQWSLHCRPVAAQRKGARCRTQDTGCRNAGCKMQSVECRLQHANSWVQDAGWWVQDACSSISTTPFMLDRQALCCGGAHPWDLLIKQCRTGRGWEDPHLTSASLSFYIIGRTKPWRWEHQGLSAYRFQAFIFTQKAPRSLPAATKFYGRQSACSAPGE